jgi:short-subunit dehydrogenase
MCDGYIRSLNAGGKSLPGTIINVSSQMGFLEFSARSSYAVSKIAMVKLAQYIHAGEFH